jgi:putative salt-induced outer membrane protein
VHIFQIVNILMTTGNTNMHFLDFKPIMHALFLLTALLASASLTFAVESKKVLGLSNESEAGAILLTGNANSQSYNLKQVNHYIWDANTFIFETRYLRSSAEDVETARSWALGGRFEREIESSFGLFLGQNLESDIFAGYLQRYNSDFGGQYAFIDNKHLKWNGEVGYRFTVENGRTVQAIQNYLRFYTLTKTDWTETFSTKFWLEFLPNLSSSYDFQLNSELSAYVSINKIFAIKTGYLFKMRKRPVFPATNFIDTQYTTALIAKF